MYKNNITQIFISLLLAVILFVSTVSFVSADGQTCITQYGGAVVCGNNPTDVPHAPVNAGIGDINLGVLGGFLLVGSLISFRYSKRLTKTS